jgi:hypothetical protein
MSGPFGIGMRAFDFEGIAATAPSSAMTYGSRDYHMPCPLPVSACLHAQKGQRLRQVGILN